MGRRRLAHRRSVRDGALPARPLCRARRLISWLVSTGNMPSLSSTETDVRRCWSPTPGEVARGSSPRTATESPSAVTCCRWHVSRGPALRVDRSLEDFFLVHGFYPFGRTPYAGIRALAPGAVLEWREGRREARQLPLGEPWPEVADAVAALRTEDEADRGPVRGHGARDARATSVASGAGRGPSGRLRLGPGGVVDPSPRARGRDLFIPL
jgi:hypothetical protein